MTQFENGSIKFVIFPPWILNMWQNAEVFFLIKYAEFHLLQDINPNKMNTVIWQILK